MRSIKLLFVCFALLFGSQVHAQEDTEPIGWISPAGPSGVFGTPSAACVAQWEDEGMDNGYSRFMGIKRRSDDLRFVHCEWTRWQYLCPEETGGGPKCGYRIPSYVQIACPEDYLATADGFCRRGSAFERPCDDPCDNDSGRANPKTRNPVVVATGAKRLSSVDYASADGLFRIERQYRSFQVGRPIQQRVLPRALPRGLDGYWNFGFSYELQFGIFTGSPSEPNATVAILMPDGTGYGFQLQADGSWAEYPGAGSGTVSNNLKLEFVGAWPSDLSTVRDFPSTWKLTDRNDTVWTIETRTGAKGGNYLFGWPVMMKTRSGYAQSFAFGEDSRLASMTDSLGRTATFEWDTHKVTTIDPVPAGSEPTPVRVSSIDLPDGTSLVYDYEKVTLEGIGAVFSSSKWNRTWGGGSKPVNAFSVVPALLPELRRLKTVERRAANDDVLDSVTYLHEHDRFTRNVTGIVDHRGERVGTYEYDTAGRVISSERADGAERNTFVYDTAGSDRTREVTNEYDKRETYRFSQFSASQRDYRLTNVDSDATANTQAASAAISYGSNTYISSTTDAEGRLITTTRDARGRPISVTEASGTPDARTTTITWHADFNVPEIIVTPGLTETRSYDTQGRLTSVTMTDTTTHALPYATNGQARTYTYAWDANGRLLSENGPLAANGAQDDLSNYTYDASGNLLTATNALGHVTTYGSYDANGRPGTMTDPNGIVTTFAYDPLGRVETITIEHPNNASLNATTAMSYDAVGNLTQLTLPGTAPLVMEYDTVNRLTAMLGAGGERWDYTYDAAGNVERETVTRTDGSTARMVRRQFDELGRLMRETLGTRSPSQWGYDRVSNVVSAADPNGFAATASFDALDRVVSTVAPDGGTIASSYDAQDNPLTFTDPISVTTQFVHNGFGEVVQETSPDRGTSTYVYDAAGRMVQSTDGRGQVVDYTRDILGRITRMQPLGRPASEMSEYQWDSGGMGGSYTIGRLGRVTDSSGRTRFAYDHRGNVTIKEQSIGGAFKRLSYSYDTADRITRIIYPSGRWVLYDYDAWGRVERVRTRENSSSPYVTVASGHQYEAFGPTKSIALGNGLTAVNDWGTDGRLASRRLTPTSGGAALSHLAYRRDPVGRIGAIADYVNPASSVIYGYDEMGRLTMAVSDTQAQSSESYSYTPGTSQLASFTDDSGTRTIAYDGRGNTVSETRPGGVTVAATYDGHGRLESYDRSNIGAQNYTYNGLGDRVRVDKPTGTRHFVYDAWGRVVAEYGTSASDVRAEFIWTEPPAANDNSPFGGGDHIAGYAPLALVAPNAQAQLELYWVHGNHLGVPIVTTDAQGSVVDPGNDFLRPGFPGQSQVLSDLYYNRNRDYDPVTGRYIQADPIGLAGDVNPYVYANADPVNGIDPDGLLWRQAGGAALGAGSNLAWQLYNNGGRFDCVNWWEVGEWALAGSGLAGLVPRMGSRRAFREIWRDKSGSVPGPIHKNSLNYIGETHVYAIRGPNGIHKIGQSSMGRRLRDGLSRRAEQQVRRLGRKTNQRYRSQIRRTFQNKRDAREYETKLIERYRRMYGEKTLPGNKTNR
ncbi:RHS repeat-associated core domain-containing protein [uncultured Erythrobacter sp.]|uniref:RHS repeat-associated core domain-containing protein n=1 Tax=uncultured Erythrobacter sp. TaxID=263913 RepID=UPI00261EF4FA|nr:RHS repeat-associated core domain-containing protein [uncultured Erythrobacter sp.]